MSLALNRVLRTPFCRGQRNYLFAGKAPQNPPLLAAPEPTATIAGCW